MANGEVICEQIHGHNYRVKCQVTGTLNEHGYVIDFIALRDHLAQLVARLDHHVLLATQHPDLSVEEQDDEVTVRFEQRRWVFPRQDCVLLPIANTTAELLASYLSDELVSSNAIPQSVSELVVSVDENEGQWGECIRTAPFESL